ncbi:MAG: winged helix-turn-helix transcriptional regulator [Bacteroidota bacterium]
MVVDHLVDRKNFGTVPPRVEYRLTERGRQVFPLIEAMEIFARQYNDPDNHTL